MSRSDRARWDQKWAAVNRSLDKPHELLLKHRYLLTGGQALDIACGRGQNAIWLAEVGYNVLGVDISPVALKMAREQRDRCGLNKLVDFKEIDLNNWSIPAKTYDLIIVFRFLDRQLFPAIKAALHPGGLLFYATRHTGLLQTDPEANPDFLLEVGELQAAFGEWQTLFQHEGAEMAKIVVRKPISE